MTPGRRARSLVLVAIVVVAGCRRAFQERATQPRRETVAPRQSNRIWSIRTAPMETTAGEPRMVVEVEVTDLKTVDAFMPGLWPRY